MRQWEVWDEGSVGIFMLWLGIVKVVVVMGMKGGGGGETLGKKLSVIENR